MRPQQHKIPCSQSQHNSACSRTTPTFLFNPSSRFSAPARSSRAAIRHLATSSFSAPWLGGVRNLPFPPTPPPITTPRPHPRDLHHHASKPSPLPEHFLILFLGALPVNPGPWRLLPFSRFGFWTEDCLPLSLSWHSLRQRKRFPSA